jgi:hypothetical protein
MLPLLTVMLLAPPLDGSKEIKLSSHGLLFQSIGERFFSDSEWVIATDFTFHQADRLIEELPGWLIGKQELPAITMVYLVGNSEIQIPELSVSLINARG